MGVNKKINKNTYVLTDLIEFIINEFNDKLDDREKYILLSRVSNRPGKEIVTQEELSNIFNISITRISQIEKKAICKIKKSIKEIKYIMEII